MTVDPCGPERESLHELKGRMAEKGIPFQVIHIIPSIISVNAGTVVKSLLPDQIKGDIFSQSCLKNIGPSSLVPEGYLYPLKERPNLAGALADGPIKWKHEPDIHIQPFQGLGKGPCHVGQTAGLHQRGHLR
jgi:hypothetical protein